MNCEGRDGFNFYDDCEVSRLQNVPIHRQVTGRRLSPDSRVLSEDPFGMRLKNRSLNVIAHSEFLPEPKATSPDIATLLLHFCIKG